MEPFISLEGARVFHGDCREVLAGLPDNSVDSIVTDPPYELGFMGKKWDSSGIAYDLTVWGECLRVLKPGGHLLAFGGTRTWHRLAVAVEDAGFEIRDNIAWMYGSGFPKSLDVSKAIDKAITAPTTPEAKHWAGWGTALKPAHEPIVVARKPLTGTVAETVLEWGTGGLNIDGSRIAHKSEADRASATPGGRVTTNSKTHALPGVEGGVRREIERPDTLLGRWPANVILDEYTADLLDQQSGTLKSGAVDQSKITAENRIYGALPKNRSKVFAASEGGASRFFYCAKASKRDRNEGLEDLPEQVGQRTHDGGEDTRVRPLPANRNIHPTVKPTTLMRYLVKLVTPTGGTVLDPFTGSGSTGKAAILEGFDFVGVELTEDYLPIIGGRLKWALENRDDGALF